MNNHALATELREIADGFSTRASEKKDALKAAADILEQRRFCADCGATVALQPDWMGCHCRNVPWHILHREGA